MIDKEHQQVLIKRLEYLARELGARDDFSPSKYPIRTDAIDDAIAEIKRLGAEIDLLESQTTTKQRWIISAEIQPCYFYPEGRINRGQPMKCLWIVDVHPAVEVATNKIAFAKLSEMTDKQLEEKSRGGPPPRCDDILAIYSATEIPDGLLTDDQIDALS